MNFGLLLKIYRLRRKGFLRFRPAVHSMRLVCLNGECPTPCCRIVAPPQLSEEEAASFGRNSHEVGGEIMLKEGKCGCCFLRKNGACAVYRQRPKACIDYPWYNIDGKLYYDAGCPGLRFDAEGRPDVNAIRPFDFYLKSLAAWLRSAIIFWLRGSSTNSASPVRASR